VDEKESRPGREERDAKKFLGRLEEIRTRRKRKRFEEFGKEISDLKEVGKKGLWFVMEGEKGSLYRGKGRWICAGFEPKFYLPFNCFYFINTRKHFCGLK
jgi:hypothetical protein